LAGPIGIFDSGYGGLTILKRIRQTLPDYDFLYLGDNARSPYGIRSFETIYDYSLEAVKYLLSKDCHLIILACNTASAKALKNIQKLDLPNLDPDRRVLGVIRPTVEMVGQITATKKIGVLATQGTVSSESYVLEMRKLFPEISIYQEACPMWVPLIENGELNSEGSRFFVKRNIDNLLSKSEDIDTILLGCTHYPVLYEIIKEYLPPEIKLISQGRIVAASLKDYLQRHPEIDEHCGKSGQVNYITTGSSADFDKRASEFLGEKISSFREENLSVELLTL